MALIALRDTDKPEGDTAEDIVLSIKKGVRRIK
jgi:hypothetical protein